MEAQKRRNDCEIEFTREKMPYIFNFYFKRLCYSPKGVIINKLPKCFVGSYLFLRCWFWCWCWYWCLATIHTTKWWVLEAWWILSIHVVHISFTFLVINSYIFVLRVDLNCKFIYWVAEPIVNNLYREIWKCTLLTCRNWNY